MAAAARGRKRPRPARIAEAPASVYGACGNVEDYDIECEIGSGTYGTVFRARHRVTGDLVALKRVILHNESSDGFPITSLREVKLLRAMRHPNIVHLREVVVGAKRDDVYLVFEYCRHDLADVLDAGRGSFSLSEVKRLMLDLLAAVRHLHRRWVVHRDIKMSNLLYDAGAVKVADFGLARYFAEPLGRMTPRVVTLHYRAPELLLQAPSYGTAVDMWSAGCILGELLLGRVLLPGRAESEQVNLVFQLVGTPTEARWPGWSRLPGARDIALAVQSTPRGSRIAKVLPMLPPDGVRLMEGLLCLDPRARLTAKEAMEHEFFCNEPLPQRAQWMPTFATRHGSGEARPPAAALLK